MTSPLVTSKPSQNGTSVYMENFTSVYIQFKRWPYCFIQFIQSKIHTSIRHSQEQDHPWWASPLKCAFFQITDFSVSSFSKEVFVMYIRPPTDSKGLAKKKVSGCCVQSSQNPPTTKLHLAIQLWKNLPSTKGHFWYLEVLQEKTSQNHITWL